MRQLSERILPNHERKAEPREECGNRIWPIIDEAFEKYRYKSR